MTAGSDLPAPDEIRRALLANPVEAQQRLQQLVLMGYGPVMLRVQAFESLLGSLALTAATEVKHPTTRKGIERNLSKQAAEIRRLLNRAAPQEVYRQLEGKIHPELLAEIKYMLVWRNTLTHRYLRQRMVSHLPTRLEADPETPGELWEIGLAFDALNERIQEEQRRLATALMRQIQDEQPGTPELFERFARGLFEMLLATPPRFERWNPKMADDPEETEE